MSVYFWDTSALAKYYHQESGTNEVTNLIEAPDAKHFVSQITLVEMLSVAASKVRGDELDEGDFHMFRKVFLFDVKDRMVHVLKTDPSILGKAQKLILAYGPRKGVGLRTLDGIQLATAHVLRERGLRRFVTSDNRLCLAAEAEGFDVIDPTKGGNISAGSS